MSTLHYYDMPLAGTLSQNGVLYAFRCVEGHAEDENLWTYTLIHDEELPLLEAGGDVGAALDEVANSRSYVVALAREGHGIVAWAFVEEPADFASPLEAAISLFREFEADLENLRTA